MMVFWSVGSYITRLLYRSRAAVGPGLQHDWWRSQWSGSTGSALRRRPLYLAWDANDSQGFTAAELATPRVGTTTVPKAMRGAVGATSVAGVAVADPGAVVAPGAAVVTAGASVGSSALPQANMATSASAIRARIRFFVPNRRRQDILHPPISWDFAVLRIRYPSSVGPARRGGRRRRG